MRMASSNSPQQLNLRLLPLILALALVVLNGSEAALIGGRTGGWTPIQNTNDPTIVEIAKFAVSEYNKQSKGEILTYEKVIKGESQVVAGTNYKLTIMTTASSGAGAGNYEALVWDKPWQHFRQLTSFKKV